MISMFPGPGPNMPVTHEKGTYEPGVVLVCILKGIVKTIVKVGSNFAEQIVGDIFRAIGDAVIADLQSGMTDCMLKCRWVQGMRSHISESEIL